MNRRSPSLGDLAMCAAAKNKAKNRPAKTISAASNKPKRAHALKRNKLIIAIDYGTTFLTVAYLFIKGEKSELQSSLADVLKEVRVIRDDWSGSDTENTTVLPESLYEDLGHSSSGRKSSNVLLVLFTPLMIMTSV